MTKRLEKAFAEAAKLSREEQDELATWLIEELASERRWKNTFSSSHGQLSELADDALGEHRAGHTQELEPDNL